MTRLAVDYRRQWAWRPWPAIFEALPPVGGRTILDLGCGPGDQAVEFVARGARVVGIDMNEDLLRAARSKGLDTAEFRHGDLRAPLEPGLIADGLWSSFSAAFLPDLAAALTTWAPHLRPGGWAAITEIDDMFGHRPLAARTVALFETYARDALQPGRYDFLMGRKIADHLERSGFRVTRTMTLEDRELAFAGPAGPEVLEAWRRRLDRMTLLHDFCGREFGALRDDFLGCLARPDHRSLATVRCCIATR